MGTKTQKLSNVVDQIVEWQSVFTGDGSTGLTAVAGRGYFIDTTSSTVTVTLPASPKAGDIVQLKDYARKWGTNAVSIASALFDGVAAQTPSFSTDGQTVTLVYMDGTKGWSLINEDTTTALGALFVTATGGTVTTSGDYKVHTFTGDGCFVVSCGGNPAGSVSVDYLVVAGGGGGGRRYGGGGGAGGYRESHSTPVSGCYSASPFATPTGLPVSATTYPVTVGGGGAGGVFSPGTDATKGSNSVFSTITSSGGGAGANQNCAPDKNGGSGSGAAVAISGLCTSGGTGNTPPVSPSQGNDGGAAVNSGPSYGSGGGGGRFAVGGNGTTTSAGNGGNGTPTSISGSATTYAGGGGGGTFTGPGGAGGPGGGGAGGCQSAGTAGTANTGGGGGGGSRPSPGSPDGNNGGAGGKGIVIIRYKYQ